MKKEAADNFCLLPFSSSLAEQSFIGKSIPKLFSTRHKCFRLGSKKKLLRFLHISLKLHCFFKDVILVVGIPICYWQVFTKNRKKQLLYIKYVFCIKIKVAYFRYISQFICQNRVLHIICLCLKGSTVFLCDLQILFENKSFNRHFCRADIVAVLQPAVQQSKKKNYNFWHKIKKHRNFFHRILNEKKLIGFVTKNTFPFK